jgi:hypothetical protein
MAKYVFDRALWLGLAAISFIYTAIILIPYYTQGIYRMSAYEMWKSPDVVTNTPPLQCACVLWIFGGLPLLLLSPLHLWITWYRVSLSMRIIKLLLLLYAVAAVIISFVYGGGLFQWALSLDLAQP